MLGFWLWQLKTGSLVCLCVGQLCLVASAEIFVSFLKFVYTAATVTTTTTAAAASAAAITFIFIVLVLITLQEQIDTVTVGVENVGDEDWMEIKIEENYVQLVDGVKCEQEVSVLW
jgi:hypothetical protein